MNTTVADKFADFPDDDVGPKFIKSRRSFSVDGITQSIKNFATLSEALRMLGAAVLVTSMSVFLLQGWNEGNDIGRYLMLLSQTGLLAAAGFAMSHGLRETRGARIFFGLSLVSIPANFTILGALVYSVFSWDIAPIDVPGYALWQIDSFTGTGLTFAGAMLVLIPVALFCFAILARQSAKTLSLHFLLLNSLLLLPIRGSMAAGSVALAGVLYALFVVGKLSAKDRSLKTGEGKFALATLFIPVGIILFRSMYFYQVDSLMIAMVSMSAFLAARQVSVFPERSARLATLLESLSVPIAMVASLALADALRPVLTNALAGPAFATIFTLLALDIVRRTDSGALARIITMTISIAVALGFTTSVFDFPSALTAILCITAGAILLLMGVSISSRMASLFGVLTVVAGILFGFQEILQLVLTSSWVELAIFGACAIAMGSIVDRHGVVIKLRLVKWFDAISEQRARIALED